MPKFSIAKTSPKLTKALNKLNRDMHDDKIDLSKRNAIYIQDACEVARIKRVQENHLKMVYVINNHFVTDSRSMVKRLAVNLDNVKISQMEFNPDFVPEMNGINPADEMASHKSINDACLS